MKQKNSKFLPQIPAIRKRRKAFDPNTIPAERNFGVESSYSVFQYNEKELKEYQAKERMDWQNMTALSRLCWINADGLRKSEIEVLCAEFKIHPLIVEDILSVGQRAKMDAFDNKLFCLLPMIYFNEASDCIELEQVSIITGENFVLSFQEDAKRDVFDPLRNRLRNAQHKIREKGADYLCYALLDVIVDSYFGILEKVSYRVEAIEDKLLNNREINVPAEISHIRKEVTLLKRSIAPVRDLVAGFLKTDNAIVKEINEKYFKDVSDHIIQANENCENLRETISNLQEMYNNRINLKMNEVMKIFTMVSLLLAPATVIGGIFGMNFENIPMLHDQKGFYISVVAMFLIPASMLFYFKRKGWF